MALPKNIQTGAVVTCNQNPLGFQFLEVGKNYTIVKDPVGLLYVENEAGELFLILDNDPFFDVALEGA